MVPMASGFGTEVARSRPTAFELGSSFLAPSLDVKLYMEGVNTDRHTDTSVNNIPGSNNNTKLFTMGH